MFNKIMIDKRRVYMIDERRVYMRSERRKANTLLCLTKTVR
jgi:hypothetical protein